MPRNPERTYVRGPVMSVLRLVGPVVAVLSVVVMIVVYPRLPDEVPTHFGLTGDVDSFGPRWNVFILAGISLLLQAGVLFLSSKPHFLNYPVVVTATNAQRVYQEGERMLVWVAVALAVLFTGLNLSVLDVASGPVMLLGLVGLVAAVVLGIIRFTRMSSRSAV